MGKELVLRSLRHEKTERLPWVPFFGVHAAGLKGYTAEEMLRSPEKLSECMIEAARLYHPDGMPLFIDTQLEAECAGCRCLYSEDAQPSVFNHPFEGSSKELPCHCRLPHENAYRIPDALKAAAGIKEAIGEDVALYGVVCGPVTLAYHLRGNEFLTDLLTDASYAMEFADFCTEACVAMVELYASIGADVIAIADPVLSQAPASAFDGVLKDAYTACFDYIRSRELLSTILVPGNIAAQLDALCRCGPDGIAVDESVNFKFARFFGDKYNITFYCGLPTASVLKGGTPESCAAYTADWLRKAGESRNLILSTGYDLPFDVPKENVIACAQTLLS